MNAIFFIIIIILLLSGKIELIELVIYQHKDVTELKNGKICYVLTCNSSICR